MKRIAICAIYVFILGLGTVYAEEPSSAFPSADMFGKLTRPLVQFDHDGHNEANQLSDCVICHHLYENGARVDGESSEDKQCAECHSIDKTPENRIQLMKAFHLQCKACHDQEGKGPRLCGECHQK